MITKSEIRLHLIIILSAMAILGAIFSRLLLMFGLNSLVLRNLIVMTTSYASFFILIRIWLSYLDLNKLRDASNYSTQKLPSNGGERREGSWFDIFYFPDVSGELGLIIGVIVVIALLVLVGIWIGIEGPTILIDAAFDVSLSLGLVQASRRIARGDWHIGVLKRTIVPFLIVLSISTLVMMVASSSCPNRNRFSDVVHQCWHSKY